MTYHSISTMKISTAICSGLILSFLASQPAEAVESPASGDAVIAAWTVIAGPSASDPLTPQIVARFAIANPALTAQNCSDYLLTGTADGTASSPVTPANRKLPANLNAADWPITLCQASMADDWNSARLTKAGHPVSIAVLKPVAAVTSGMQTLVSGQQQVEFPGPHNVGRKYDAEIRIIGIGDTGCRDDSACQPDVENIYQVAAGAAAENPDLVFHVGDFRYIEENNFGSNKWTFFETEFFKPAQLLLMTSAFAPARGNHEQCSDRITWYGDDWLFLFEPSDSLTPATCPKPGSSPSNGNGFYDGPAALMKPWYFDVAPKKNLPAHMTAKDLAHRFVMLDSSPDCGNFTSRNDCQHNLPWQGTGNFKPVKSNIVESFKIAMEYSKGASAKMGPQTSVWWVTHQPVWNLAGGGYGWTVAWRDMLKEALPAGHEPTSLCSGGQCNPNTIVAGHQHNLQRIRFLADIENPDSAWKLPQSHVIGNGGVAERGVPKPGICQSPFQPGDGDKADPDGRVVSVGALHGFTIWTRSAADLKSPAGWASKACLVDQLTINSGNAADFHISCGSIESAAQKYTAAPISDPVGGCY